MNLCIASLESHLPIIARERTTLQITVRKFKSTKIDCVIRRMDSKARKTHGIKIIALYAGTPALAVFLFKRAS